MRDPCRADAEPWAGLPHTVAVEELPPALWEAWPPASLARSRRWLQACRVPGDRALSVRNEAGDGLLACRLVCLPDAWPRLNAVDVCAGHLFDVPFDEADADEARRLAIPHLLVAFPGYDTGVVGNPSPDTARSLVEAVEEVARALGALPVYAYVPAGERPLLEALGRSGYVTGVVAATAMLELPGPSFADYLASLSSSRRAMVRRERRRFTDSGATVATLPATAAAPVLPQVAELEANVSAHHGQPEPASRPAAINARLAEAFGEEMLVVLARRGGRCLASATVFRHGDELHVRAAGVDYEAAQPVCAHFVAAYYTPIELACALGLRRVRFGIAAFRPKVNRGARLVPLLAALPAGAPPSLLRLLDWTDRWLRRSLPLQAEGPGVRL